MTMCQMVCGYGKKKAMYSINLQAKAGYFEGTGLGVGECKCLSRWERAEMKD